MRSNHETTSQTTCDGDNCTAYSITGFYERTTPKEQAAKHQRDLVRDGWADVEGRDYCPDCQDDEPGMCPVCDTTVIERCVACGRCRCDTHENCIRPTP